ncbi:zinc finger protein required for cell viability [Scheffersomyces coipomensis]|uniref:zinc finger protein required for cell viability n=1 Tax=Scheffersomyces coipomensis TaxID=1788519 RepID=UPI00315DC6F9
MSSVVYYKFLHQKNKSVIYFDGTAITVFDLKRDIILQNQLGSGHDFNLRLYHSEQPEVEYELDQDSIPRSSYVLAKRSPAIAKAGRAANASRYITGKPRVNRRVINTTNTNNSAALAASANNTTTDIALDDTISEADKIKLILEKQSASWTQTQDELATHKMVYNRPSATSGKPEDAPPPGYICYRCGKKDHWIKNCPTNNDPNFEGKKILRTTGIPRSYLKTISKEQFEKQKESSEVSTNDNGDLVDKDGQAILITDEGEYAVAVADSKTWITYQEKQQNAALKARQEFDAKIIEAIEQDKKYEFLDPLINPNNERVKRYLKNPIVMTPCCQDKSRLQKLTNFNYNQTELEQVLIENDFHCPNCGTEDIYIDDLIPNKSLEEELAEYIKGVEAKLGVENPLKRPAPGDEENGEGDDSKIQKLDLPVRPNVFTPTPVPIPGQPPMGLPIPPFGMPPIPMPMPGMPIPGMPMYMPPPPPGMPLSFPPQPPQNSNNNGNGHVQ